MSLTLAAWALAAALGAAPAGGGDARQIKLAAPGLTGVNLTRERVEFFSNHFAQEMNNRGIRVITAQEVNAVIGLARTQQLMGCDESATNCMTELADALGVDGVITGSIGQFGPTYQANLVIASNGNGKLLSSVTVKADSEQGMLDQLGLGARQAASDVGSALGRPARRFATQSVYTDVVELIGSGLNLKYARQLGPRWSLYTSFGLVLSKPLAEFPGVNVTEADLAAQARFHFFDTPPFGLYLGAGLGFFSGYGFGSDPTAAVALGSSAFLVNAEVGYAIALFDFLHLSVGLQGNAGVAYLAFVGATGLGGGAIAGFVPLVDGRITAGAGVAF